LSLTFPLLEDAFAAAMDRLGPFEPGLALAVAVSGGADSMALALLAHDWAAQRSGTVRALVVDHGLRPESAAEATVTVARLHQLGIASTVLPLITLQHGSALAERARIMRYEALSRACRSNGTLHLLLGHHTADQVETMMMRALGRSMTHGLAGMSALVETTGVRLLRPLLAISPDVLRQFLRVHGVAWVEDPSNRDLRALRPRLRHRFGGGSPAALISAARSVGVLRAQEEAATAAELAERATIRPEGFALLSEGRIGVAALASLIRVVGGAGYAPAIAQTVELAARPRPATVGGVRILRAGEGLLLVREERAIADPVLADHDAMWDGRFRVVSHYVPTHGEIVGKLGRDAIRFRGQSSLPSVVLRTLPAVRLGEALLAVPHLGFCAENRPPTVGVLFEPAKPAAGACFLPG
jgi:tRNA(Ile)-lysidine synthase